MTDEVLDPLIHSQARLRIMTSLATIGLADAVTFPKLQGLLDLTAGNLSTHLRRLEDAGYVEVVKTHEGRTPTTYVSITRAGHRAYEDYVAALTALLTPTSPIPPSGRTEDRHPEHGDE